MDSFKLDYFKKEHKEQSINFTTLSKYECDEVYASFCLAYQIKAQDRSDIFGFIQNNGRFISSMNAQDKDFDLYLLIQEQCGSQMPIHLNVCWDNFCTIDCFDSNDLATYFDYIWYPAADDIIIFDNLYKICLMVRHDGAIYILNYQKR